MFDKKEFLNKLNSCEIKLKVDPTNDEINAIADYFEGEEDAMHGAIYFGFVLGCVKTVEHMRGL